ncbi:MAG: hypothetical protein ACKO3G_07665 [Planctomycetaceae bacterium]
MEATAGRCEPSIRGRRPTGSALRAAIRAVLGRSGMAPQRVGHVNAHGLSTRDMDRIEAHAIAAELGDVPVTAPKGAMGHLGAGGGAVELAAGILAIDAGLVPPTLNHDTPDPECPVNVVVGEALAGRPASVLAVNLCATGQAAAVLVSAG